MKNYFIGIDIGGTRIKGVVRCGDNILKQKVVLTKSELSGEKIVSRIIKLIQFLFNSVNIDKNNNSQLHSIGVGVPGIFEKKGKIINLPNLQNLNGVNFVDTLKKKFGKSVRVKIVNDAQTVFYFYKDELKKKKEKNVAFLTLGTSIGCCLVLNGKHHVGGGLASQLAGSYFISKNKYKRINDIIAIKFMLSECRKYGINISSFSEFTDLLKQDNIIALKIFENYGENLGYVFRNLFQILHLEKIYITGGISNLSTFYLEKAVKTFSNNGSGMGVCPIEIIELNKGVECGAIGASKLFK